ncbi:MAG: conjugal transfer protein TraV [Novosphingobium sp.]|nr:conjugal transfer protein TraV [Novosphingobium sp.]
MRRPIRTAACLLLLTSIGACVGLGTNVEGDFSCRALKGDCAPTAVSDEDALKGLSRGEKEIARAYRRAGIAPGDRTRTAERTMKVVFPAHVDSAGTLHDERSAWIVVEDPHWAGELRDTPRATRSSSIMRALSRQLREARKEAAIAHPDIPVSASADDTVPTDNPFSLASPLPSPVPSEASEANAGAPVTAPAAGRPDSDTIPSGLVSRPLSPAPVLNFPSAEAVDAARAKSREEQKETK